MVDIVRVDIFELQHILEELTQLTVRFINELGSSVNHTYEIQMGEDASISVVKFMTREPLNEIEHLRYDKTRWIYERLEELGVRVPRILHCDSIIREFDDFTIYGIIVLEKICCSPVDIIWPEMDTESKVYFARSFARLLRKIHSIELPSYGEIHPQRIEQNIVDVDSWYDYLIELATAAVDKLIEEGNMDEDLLQGSLQFLKDHQEELEYQETPKLIHNDIWRGNFLFDLDEIYPLDWEWSIAGDPAMDFLWIETDIFHNESEEVKEVFYEEYGIDWRDDEFKLKIRLLSIFRTLESSAFGFVAHNPSVEAFHRMEKFLKLFLYEEPMGENY